MRNRFVARVLLLAVFLLPIAFRLVAAEDFYETRYRVGVDAYRSRQYASAVDEFRVAAFGFLDRPLLLTRALVHLSLAQKAAGRAADLETTLGRFVDVEQRFPSYQKTNLDASVRGEFEALLRAKISRERLIAVPSLAPFAPPAQPAGSRKNVKGRNAKRRPSN